MKKLGFVVILLLVVVAGVWAFNAHSQQADKTTGAVREISGVQKMPDSYTEKASYKGKLVELSYKMHMADGSGRTVAKKAMVYLPYNYSEGTKYDVFYLMHGYGGTYETFLGSKVSPRTFKRVLDNMIANGKIKPLIVVTPEYTEEYADYYSIIEGEGTEIVKDLMPLIESKYSTYAASTSSKGLVRSRAHRAVGGFSMGGCATWYTLKNYSKYFQYYMPMSMPMYYSDGGYVEASSVACAKEIYDGASATLKKNMKIDIFAASGGSDFMNKATKEQAVDLCEYDGFTSTKTTFKDGNVMFFTWKGHKHSFRESYPYLYNGLRHFFH